MVVFDVADTGIGMTEAEVGAAVRDLRPGRRDDHAQVRRQRARPCDHAAPGAADGRRRHREQRRRARGRRSRSAVPRELAGVPADASRDRAVTPGTPVSTRGGKVALVIEDDASASELIKRWLEKSDYDIVTTGNRRGGRRACAGAASRPHPARPPAQDGSGWDVLSRLRGDPALNEIPVILTTVDDDRRRGLVAGASEHLTKPLTQERLLQALQTYDAPVTGEILVIDDDPDAVDLIARSAARIGLSVRRAFNGTEGLAAARAQRAGRHRHGPLDAGHERLSSCSKPSRPIRSSSMCRSSSSPASRSASPNTRRCSGQARASTPRAFHRHVKSWRNSRRRSRHELSDEPSPSPRS